MAYRQHIHLIRRWDAINDAVFIDDYFPDRVDIRFRYYPSRIWEFGELVFHCKKGIDQERGITFGGLLVVLSNICHVF